MLAHNTPPTDKVDWRSEEQETASAASELGGLVGLKEAETVGPGCYW